MFGTMLQGVAVHHARLPCGRCTCNPILDQARERIHRGATPAAQRHDGGPVKLVWYRWLVRPMDQTARVPWQTPRPPLQYGPQKKGEKWSWRKRL